MDEDKDLFVEEMLESIESIINRLENRVQFDGDFSMALEQAITLKEEIEDIE